MSNSGMCIRYKFGRWNYSGVAHTTVTEFKCPEVKISIRTAIITPPKQIIYHMPNRPTDTILYAVTLKH